MSDCKEVFTDIYARKVWGDGSGGGSGEQARPYCDFVSLYLQELQLPKLAWEKKTVLDIGCGDLRIYKRIKWGAWWYHGVDASSHLGFSGSTTGGGPSHYFQGDFDALTDELPRADLVLCKEVLQHLSNAQVQLLLDRTAHYPRRLFTNTTQVEGVGVNEDIETGNTRPVDLTLPPFSQPARTVFTYGCWIVQELTAP